MHLHSSTVDDDCLLRRLCMTSPGLDEEVSAAASKWYDCI